MISQCTWLLLIQLRKEDSKAMCVVQQRSQEARQNWESALESKDRALTQLEDALVTQKRSLQQQVDQQQAAVSMTHNQLIQGTDAQILMQRQLEQSQQQVTTLLVTAVIHATHVSAEHSVESSSNAAMCCCAIGPNADSQSRLHNKQMIVWSMEHTVSLTITFVFFGCR